MMRRAQDTDRDYVDVSIILPCYRAAARAAHSVRELRDYAEARGLAWEVIVVEDGPCGVEEVVAPFAPFAHVLSLPGNRGKGAAVRAGFGLARGRVVAFTDVDLPFGIEVVQAAADSVRRGSADVVIGDRTLPSSRYDVHVSAWRRITSAGCSILTRYLMGLAFVDTQCGLKALRGDIARALTTVSIVDRFAFDIEILAILSRARLDIQCIPVVLVRNEESSVRIVPDAARSAVDLIRIAIGLANGRYETPLVKGVTALGSRERVPANRE